MRSPELQKRINNAMRACNLISDAELGRPKRKRAPRRITKAVEIRNCPKIDAIKKYRAEHPGAGLLEAAEATGFFTKAEGRAQ